MTDTQTESALHAALDADPGDTLTRSALADWLLDAGRDEEAEGQRWLLETGKYPHDTGLRRPSVRWRWYSNGWNDKPRTERGFTPHAWVGHKTCQDLRFRIAHASRRSAEADLIAWARRTGLIGVPT